MTTGFRQIGGFFNTPSKWGNLTGSTSVGRRLTKSWTGSDGRTTSNPTYRVRPGTKKTRVFLEPQPYQMDKEVEYRGLFRVTAKPDEGIYGDRQLEVSVSGHISARPAVPVQERYKLLAKVHEKAFGSGFNPLVFAAEGRDALDMIGNAAVSVGSAIHAARTRDWRLLQKALGFSEKEAKRITRLRKGAAGRVLETQYGWIPLLSDAEDAAKFIAEASLERRPSQIKVRRRLTKVDSLPYWQGQWAAFSHTTWTTKLQAVVILDAPVSYFPTLASVSTVLWERLPWSFVADWFVPIGSYLSALETASKVSGKLVVTEFTTGVSDSPIPNPIRCEPIGYETYLTNRFETVYVKREVYPNLNSYIRPPLSASFGIDSWQRAVNAVALMSQGNWSALAKLLK